VPESVDSVVMSGFLFGRQSSRRSPGVYRSIKGYVANPVRPGTILRKSAPVLES
jgi:hypothetical protein